MTKQHSHVKFLKGYGFCIKVKDSKLILKNCYDPFTPPEIEEWFVKDMPYDRIILQGKGYISTESLSLLSENNRTVVLLDNRGKQVTLCHGLRDSLTATKYRIAQYDTFRIPSKRDYLVKQIIKAKIDSQIKFLKSTGNSEILQNISKLEQSGISEAVSSRHYFDNYSKLIDGRFGFKKKAGGIATKRAAICISKSIRLNIV